MERFDQAMEALKYREVPFRVVPRAEPLERPETVLGVDEAGRGPVLGPLVVAGVQARREDLEALGVADSKTLSPGRREALAEAVRGAADAVAVRVVPAEELDQRMAHASLNTVEVELFAAVIQDLHPSRDVGCFLDACDTDAHRFGTRVRRAMGTPGLDLAIVSEHRADARYPAVSAASIVAKVTRDTEMARIAQELGDAHGPVGSGYPSDPRTRAFLETYVADLGTLPPHARHRWETAKRLLPRDRTLGEFANPREVGA